MKPKNKEVFDTIFDKHPSINKLKRGDNRDEKIAGLKTKILDTLKVAEKKKRDLSCESIKSWCSGWNKEEVGRSTSTDSRGETRQRSEDEEDPSQPKRQSRPLLRPPKILITKK